MRSVNNEGRSSLMLLELTPVATLPTHKVSPRLPLCTQSTTTTTTPPSTTRKRHRPATTNISLTLQVQDVVSRAQEGQLEGGARQRASMWRPVAIKAAPQRRQDEGAVQHRGKRQCCAQLCGEVKVGWYRGRSALATARSVGQQVWGETHNHTALCLTTLTATTAAATSPPNTHINTLTHSHMHPPTSLSWWLTRSKCPSVLLMSILPVRGPPAAISSLGMCGS